MSFIDVGSAAIDQDSTLAAASTLIDLTNPANAAGVITNIEVWAETNITGLRVGTFYLVSGTTYKCRDSVAIGAVTAGSKQTFTGLSLSVEAGDFIGCYFATGVLEADGTGSGIGNGFYYVSGEYIDSGDETAYSSSSDGALSLYGSH